MEKPNAKSTYRNYITALVLVCALIGSVSFYVLYLQTYKQTSVVGISVTPSSGFLDSKVQVSGTNFTVNGRVSIYWDNILMGNTTVNNVGNFLYSLTTPGNATLGTHEIKVKDITAGKVISKSFSVVSEKVTFQLDWYLYGKHAMFFVAQEKGFYEDVGLDVSFVPGSASVTFEPTQVYTGKAQFGFLEAITLAGADAKLGMNLVMVAMIHDKCPLVISSPASLNITKPKDLEGHSLTFPSGSTEEYLWPVFAQKNDINVSKVTIVKLDYSVRQTMIISGQVDAVLTYITEIPSYEAYTPMNNIMFSDYGMDFYTNGIAVTKALLDSRPNFVRNFVKATIKGVEYSKTHPDEAIDALLAVHPELGTDNATKTILKGQLLEAVNKMTQDSALQKNGHIGYMYDDKWRDTLVIGIQTGQLDAYPDVSTLYTNEIINSIKW